MEIKLRHRVIYLLLYIIAGPFIRLFTGYRRLVMKDVPAPAIVVANHTTDLDPALVGMSFRRHMVFVASEHVGRLGFWSRLIRWAFSPIVRVKGKTDAKSGKQILRVLRGGGNVCLFAEGNRSFNGLTGAAFPATGKLVKASGATLITYRVVGGYMAAPRWGGRTRRGPITGAPVTVYTPQQLASMSAEEINRAIQTDIDEDAYARQLRQPQPYKGRALAEFIQTALYLCPKCGAVGTLTSLEDRFACGCGLHGRVDEQGWLRGEELPFDNVRDWDAWQRRQLEIVVAEADSGAICTDLGEELHRLEPGVGTTQEDTGPLSLYADRLVCAGRSFPLRQIADLAIIGRQTMVFSTLDGESWELRNPLPRSALKYKHAFDILTRRDTK